MKYLSNILADRIAKYNLSQIRKDLIKVEQPQEILEKVLWVLDWAKININEAKGKIITKSTDSDAECNNRVYLAFEWDLAGFSTFTFVV